MENSALTVDSIITTTGTLITKGAEVGGDVLTTLGGTAPGQLLIGATVSFIILGIMGRIWGRILPN